MLYFVLQFSHHLCSILFLLSFAINLSLIGGKARFPPFPLIFTFSHLARNGSAKNRRIRQRNQSPKSPHQSECTSRKGLRRGKGNAGIQTGGARVRWQHTGLLWVRDEALDEIPPCTFHRISQLDLSVFAKKSWARIGSDSILRSSNPRSRGLARTSSACSCRVRRVPTSNRKCPASMAQLLRSTWLRVSQPCYNKKYAKY